MVNGNGTVCSLCILSPRALFYSEQAQKSGSLETVELKQNIFKNWKISLVE